MNKSRIAKIVLAGLFASISLNYLKDYLEFKSSATENKPISYLFVGKRINKGGRGETYEMDYKYNNQNQSISITSEEYNLIENKKYPELYYSKKSDSIFSKWKIKKSFRITILFFVLFILAVIPWRFPNKS